MTFKSSTFRLIIGASLLLMISISTALGSSTKLINDAIGSKMRRSNRATENPLGILTKLNLTTTTQGPQQQHQQLLEQLNNILEQKNIDHDFGFEPEAGSLSTTPVISSRAEDINNNDSENIDSMNFRPRKSSKKQQQSIGHIQDTSSFSSFGELGTSQLNGRKLHNNLDNNQDEPSWMLGQSNNGIGHDTMYEHADEIAKSYGAKYVTSANKKSHSQLPYRTMIPDNPKQKQKSEQSNYQPMNLIGYPEYPSPPMSNSNSNYLANDYGKQYDTDNNSNNYNSMIVPHHHNTINNQYNPYALGSQPEMQSFTSHHNSMSKWSALHMKKAEIICAAIAISLGAIILGAPIYLIYLVLQGAMNGSSGSLSLINAVAPNTSSTSTTLGSLLRQQINRKRSGFNSAEARNGTVSLTSNGNDLIGSYLLPFVNNLKGGEIFERLNKAIDKFSKL